MPARQKKYINDAQAIADVNSIVTEVVGYYRGRRMKTPEAHAEAAADLGITPRRVTDHVGGKIYSISTDEIERIQAGHASAVAQHAVWLENRARQLRARHDALLACADDEQPTASVVRL